MRSIIVSMMLLLIVANSCQKDNENSTTIKKDIIKGRVQKGPFLNGTSISIVELNSSFKQTGKTFSTQISNNRGSFSINNIDLVSQYVELQSNGFYFNEVIGRNSNAQLTLSALTDLTDSSTININIFSTLEKKRVEYLLSQGKTFRDSKSQARLEILKIFNINKVNMVSPEYLDISKPGDDNALLLAISLILQGYRVESELTELIANLSEDLKIDGKIDNANLGTSLINHAKVLDTVSIRKNLIDKYRSLDEVVVIPDFEKYIKTFIDSTSFIYTDIIQYSDSGKTGNNLLSKTQYDYSKQVSENSTYKTSISAHVPSLVEIRVVIRFNNDYTWGIDPTNSGWIVDFSWDDPNVFIFTKDYSREDLDLKIQLLKSGSAKIEIYENKSINPIRVKEISW
jgi:hypothetical protein